MVFPTLAHEVIDNRIKRPILLLLEQHCYWSVLVLGYSAIDTMAFLNLPAEKTDVMRSDFITWADRYVVPEFNGQISGRDLYAARCTILHGGGYSRLSRGCQSHHIVHVIEAEDQNAANEIVTTVDVLVQSILKAIDRFLEDVSKDPNRAVVISSRLQYLTESVR